MSDQSITVCGNLTRDPEIRFTASGRAVASAGVAWNKRYMKDGEWVDGPTTFFNLTMWGTLGENAAATLTKGARVIVSGHMESRAYETKEGDQRIAWDLQVDDIGPSLKFATATVERAARTAPTTSPNTGGDPIYGDEAPF